MCTFLILQQKGVKNVKRDKRAQNSVKRLQKNIYRAQNSIQKAQNSAKIYNVAVSARSTGIESVLLFRVTRKEGVIFLAFFW